MEFSQAIGEAVPPVPAVILRAVVPVLRVTIDLFGTKKTSCSRWPKLRGNSRPCLLLDLEIRIGDLEHELDAKNTRLNTLEAELSQLRKEKPLRKRTNYICKRKMR